MLERPQLGQISQPVRASSNIVDDGIGCNDVNDDVSTIAMTN
jgi:hypothetical protein